MVILNLNNAFKILERENGGKFQDLIKVSTSFQKYNPNSSISTSSNINSISDVVRIDYLK